MPLAEDLQAIAIEIAREAGELARRRRGEGVAIAATKSAVADIVTEADREVEALIRARLAEPSGRATGSSARSPARLIDAPRVRTDITWVVDPIDGTVNYAYGIPSYAVSIAAVAGEPDPERWEALAAVVFNPVSGELFHAARGSGRVARRHAPRGQRRADRRRCAPRDRLRLRPGDARRRSRSGWPG